MFLSGALTPSVRRNRRPDIGFMSTKACGSTPPVDMVVAYDNGCFVGTWEPQTWQVWLRKQRPGLFAVVPDVVGDARATRERFERYAEVVRATGQPVAYAAQNGSRDYPPPWDAFEVLFVGGSNAFKLSEECWTLIAEARARGKWVHNGRVNTLTRLRACRLAGIDSVDGTFLKWGAARQYASDPCWPRLCRWLDMLNAQHTLDEAA